MNNGGKAYSPGVFEIEYANLERIRDGIVI
jgi:hypothetical protein